MLQLLKLNDVSSLDKYDKRLGEEYKLGVSDDVEIELNCDETMETVLVTAADRKSIPFKEI
jgi:hypothetical protein